VLKAQLEQTEILTDLEMNHEEFAQGQANLKAILRGEQDSADVEIGEIAPTTLTVPVSRLRQLALANSPALQQAHAMEEQGDTGL